MSRRQLLILIGGFFGLIILIIVIFLIFRRPGIETVKINDFNIVGTAQQNDAGEIFFYVSNNNFYKFLPQNSSSILLGTVNTNFDPKISYRATNISYRNTTLDSIVYPITVGRVADIGNQLANNLSSFDANNIYWLNDNQFIYSIPSQNLLNVGVTDFVGGSYTMFLSNTSNTKVAVGDLEFDELILSRGDYIVTIDADETQPVSKIVGYQIQNNTLKEISSNNLTEIESYKPLSNNLLIFKELGKRNVQILKPGGEIIEFSSSVRPSLVDSIDGSSVIALSETSGGYEIIEFNVENNTSSKITDYPKNLTRPSGVFFFNNRLLVNTDNGLYEINLSGVLR